MAHMKKKHGKHTLGLRRTNLQDTLERPSWIFSGEFWSLAVLHVSNQAATVFLWRACLPWIRYIQLSRFFKTSCEIQRNHQKPELKRLTPTRVMIGRRLPTTPRSTEPTPAIHFPRSPPSCVTPPKKNARGEPPRCAEQRRAGLPGLIREGPWQTTCNYYDQQLFNCSYLG